LPISLEIGEAETRYLLEPPDKVTPEMLFERRWAFAVLEQTIRALQAEHAATDKADAFEDLRVFSPAARETSRRLNWPPNAASVSGPWMSRFKGSVSVLAFSCGNKWRKLSPQKTRWMKKFITDVGLGKISAGSL